MKGKKTMNKIISMMISVLIFAFFTSVSFSVDMPEVSGIGKKDGYIDIESLAKSQGQLVG